MRTKFTFGILVLLFLVGLPIVYSDIDLPIENQMVLYYQFDEQNVTDYSDDIGSDIAVDINASGCGAACPTLDTGNYKVGTGSFDFVEAQSNKLQIPDSVYLYFGDSFSMCFWIDADQNGADNAMVFKADDPTYEWYAGGDTGGKIFFNPAGGSISEGGLYDIGNWEHFCFMYNGSAPDANELRMYQNGSSVGTITSSPGDTLTNTATDLFIGWQSNLAGRFYDGNMDELVIWNRSLSQEEFQCVYELGNTGTELSTGSCLTLPVVYNDTLPTVTINYPTNGDVLDNDLYPVYIAGNTSVLNGTVASVTINDTNFNNIGSVTYFNFTVNGTLTQKQYVLNVTATSEYGNVSAQTITFTFDDINPSITSSNLDTPVFHYRTRDNLSLTFSGSDNNLIYSMNITTNGYTKNISGINELTYIFNTSINTSTFSTGANTLTAGICDAHTAKEIPVWNTLKDESSKRLDYVFSDGIVKVYPLNPAKIESFDTYKSDDRYHFVYNQIAPGTINFIVESNEFIDIIGNKRGYNAWMVIPGLNKWIDFNLPGLDSSNYQVQRLSETQVKVTIINAPKYMSFESIGELNCNFYDYTYYLYDYTVYYSNPALELSTQTFSLVFDYPEPYSAEVDFVYDGTLYDTTSSGNNYSHTFVIPDITGSSVTNNFNFNWTINSTYNDTGTLTQTVTGLDLSYCINESNGEFALNISLYDEQTPAALITGDVQGTFTMWTTSKAYATNVTISLNGSSQYSLCISTNESVNVDAELFYNTTGGFTQRWYLQDDVISSNTSYLNMYNFDTQTGISDVRGVLRDDSYDYYPNVIAKLLRFYPAENVYRTVQMDKSDDFGKVLFHVIEETTDYIVTFSSGSTEIDRTNPLKFICTSSICDVTFIVDETQAVTSSDINFQYGYDNNSQMFQLNWSESTGLTSAVRLRVIKSNPSGIVDVCDTTVSSSTGTINCNTTGYDGLLTARVYTSQSPESWVLSIPIDKIVNKLYQLATLSSNEVSMWALGFAMVLSIAGLLVSIVAGVILYLASLFAIYYLGLLSYMTLTYISISFVLGMIVIILAKR